MASVWGLLTDDGELELYRKKGRAKAEGEYYFWSWYVKDDPIGLPPLKWVKYEDPPGHTLEWFDKEGRPGDAGVSIYKMEVKE